MFFFSCFFCLGPQRLEYSRIIQRDCFIPGITQANGIQKSASMELHEWSENVVNVENHQFFEETLQIFISYLSKMKRVSMFYNSSLFQYFLQLISTIFFSRVLNSGMASFLSGIMLPFAQDPWLNILLGNKILRRKKQNILRKSFSNCLLKLFLIDFF